MSAIRMRARADLRARPISVVVLTLVVAITGAGVLAGIAGARRIETAHARFRGETNPPDVIVGAPGFFSAGGVSLEEAADSSFVTATRSASFFVAKAFDGDGSPLLYPEDPEANVLVFDDGPPAGKVLAGRLPEGPDEVALGWAGDADRPAEVGDRIRIVLFNSAYADRITDSSFDPPPDAVIEVPATVTGLVMPNFYTGGGSSDIVATRAFVDAYPEAVAFHFAMLWLDRGIDDIEAFTQELRDKDPETFSFDALDEATYAARIARFPALVARIAAVFFAITGLLLVGQTLIRRTSLGGADDAILRSLGMTRRQVLVGAMIAPAVVGIAGAVLAVFGAYALSSVFPVGLAASYEPYPGRMFDASTLVLGGLILAMIPPIVSLPGAWRVATARSGIGGVAEQRGSERRSRLAAAVGRARLPVPAAVGARMALEPGHGRSATPVRSTSVALALSVTAIVAGLVFAASMAHLTATPRLRGIDFEFATGFPFGDGVFEEVALPAILDDPGFSDLSVGNFQQLVDLRGPSGESMEVSAWAVEPVRGEGVTTTMTEGRWPNATDEIALGAKTLDQLGTELGGIITLEVGDERRDVEVVGITVFPDFGFGPGLGEGAGISMDTLRELYPDSSHIELAAGNYAPGVVPADVLDRLNPTLRKIDAAVSEADIGAMGNTLSDASRYERIPLYAAACFVVAALVTLAHLLLTSARTRRRDLAVLRTLGFRGRQLMATVAWQAVTLVAVGFAIGAPAGILVGRFVWNALAEALGVIAVPVVPVTTVVILAPALALAALTVALGPATVARRAKPAQVLRAE